ncbi:MAG: hypothetical protein LBT65_01910, partial [Synergistaceae bacterium]|jgi:3-oxoacyl-[acyl-carrier-protein] synthase-3|nr:hypothetical protein [Synergistaceae bacterium]
VFNVDNRVNAPVFGDGGSAALVEYSADSAKVCFNIETFSEGYEAIIVPASGQRCRVFKSPQEEEPIQTPFGHKATLSDLYMDGGAVFDFTMSRVPSNIKILMEYAGVGEKDIDYLCLHQANKQIIQTVGAAAGFPEEKTPWTAFENYGNNTMVSIPTVINTTVKESMEVANAEKTTLLCSGYGNGLAVASCVLALDRPYLSGVKDYVKPKDFVSGAEYAEYWKRKLRGEA